MMRRLLGGTGPVGRIPAARQGSAEWQRYLLNASKILAGTAGTQAVTVLLLPVMTRAMSPAQVGVWDLLQFVFSLSLVALLLESGAIVAKRLVSFSEDRTRQSEEFSAAIQLMGITSLVFALLYLAGGWRLLDIWLGEPGTAVIWLVPGAVIANMAYQQVLAFAQHVGMVGRATVYGLLVLALNLGLGIFLIAGLRLGVMGLVAAKLVANVVGIALSIHLTRGWLRRGWWLHRVPSVLKASLPLVPYALSFFVLTYGDRLILKREVSLHDIGIYAVGSRINLVAFAVFHSFTTAYVLEYYRVGERIRDPSLRHLTVLSAAAICLVVLAVSELAPEIVSILAPTGFDPAAALVPWLLLGQACYGILSLFWIELVAREETWFVGASSAVAAGANLALNLLLVPSHGLMGAAVAQLLAFSLLLILATAYLWRRRLLISGVPPALLLLALTGGVLAVERLVLRLGLAGRLLIVVGAAVGTAAIFLRHTGRRVA